MKTKESTKRKRFLKLIKKFRELPDERFYLEKWITCNSEYSKVTSAKFLLEHPCGTAGCLAGWTVAWFPRHWKYSNLGRIPLLKTMESSIAPSLCMAEYFGGTHNDWAHVIYPLSYPVEQRGIGGVPKHLVMERLLELYNRLYKVAHKKKRFQRLIKKLSELPDERFDLRTWVNTGCPDDYQKPIPSNFLIKNKRGTTGSVGGWVVAWWPKHWHYIFGQPRLNTSDANSCPELDLSEFFGGVGSDWLEIVSIWWYESNNPSKGEVLEKVIALYKKLYP